MTDLDPTRGAADVTVSDADIEQVLKQLKHCIDKPMRNIETFPDVCRRAHDLIAALRQHNAEASAPESGAEPMTAVNLPSVERAAKELFRIFNGDERFWDDAPPSEQKTYGIAVGAVIESVGTIALRSAPEATRAATESELVDAWLTRLWDNL